MVVNAHLCLRAIIIWNTCCLSGDGWEDAREGSMYSYVVSGTPDGHSPSPFSILIISVLENRTWPKQPVGAWKLRLRGIEGLSCPVGLRASDLAAGLQQA